MGCLQLIYEPKFKIVHRTGELMRSHEAKSVQLWLSVDPLAEKFPHQSPYVFTDNNPINLIDPDGRAAVKPPLKGTKEFNSFVKDVVNKNSSSVNWSDKDGTWRYDAKKQSWIGIDESKGNNISFKAPAETSIISDLWNSPISRLAVPDKVSFSLSTSVTAFAGVSEELSFNWITRGHDASLVPYVTATSGAQAGLNVSADALVGVGIGYFPTTDLRSLNPGDASNGLLGWNAYGSVDAGAGLGGSITGSVGFSGKPLISSPTWINAGIAGGASIGAGGTGGVSYSFPVFKSQYEKE